MLETVSSVVPMTPQHVFGVVQVHLKGFQGFFLSFLGPRFLSLYYSKLCVAPEGIAFVHLNKAGSPVGFVAGSTNPRGFYSKLLKRDWLRFFMASLGAAFEKPSVIPRIVRGIFHPRNNPAGTDVAGLFSIGVLPEFQGSGVGKSLVQAFLNEARKRSCKSVFLTTDRDNNAASNAFYQKMGFLMKRQYVSPEKRRMNEYWMKLTNEDTKHG